VSGVRKPYSVEEAHRRSCLARDHGFTFASSNGDSRCDGCKRPELEHVWICDGCGEQFGWDDTRHFPASHGHSCRPGEPTAYTLVCPDKIAIVTGDVS
jgi:hypothetical protein